jgi:predicted DNA-binding transcriptional regulator AlpA
MMGASSDKPQTDSGEPYLKMKDLVDATGVPKSTLIHVNTGLLPQPMRTSVTWPTTIHPAWSG